MEIYLLHDITNGDSQVYAIVSDKSLATAWREQGNDLRSVETRVLDDPSETEFIEECLETE